MTRPTVTDNTMQKFNYQRIKLYGMGRGGTYGYTKNGLRMLRIVMTHVKQGYAVDFTTYYEGNSMYLDASGRKPVGKEDEIIDQ